MLRVNQLAGFNSGDNAQLKITSSSTIEAMDNSVLAFSIVTSLSSTITIGGTDAAKFELASNALAKTHTLRWASNAVKHIMTPDDADADGVYDITITATDAIGRSTPPQAATVTLVYNWTGAFGVDFTGDTVDYGGYTVRLVIDNLLMPYNGDLCRLRLQAANSGIAKVLAMYIGEQDTSGDAYDMKSSSPSPVQIKVNGNGAFNVQAGIDNMVFTDPINFAIDETKTYVISMFFDNTAKLSFRTGSPFGTTLATYLKSAVNEAATANVSGYTPTTGGTFMFVNHMDVTTPT